MMLEDVSQRFKRIAPAVDAWSLRVVARHHEGLAVRRGVVQPVVDERSSGAMVSVTEGGAEGYAATTDLSTAGLRAAAHRAREWARCAHGVSLAAPLRELPRERGRYTTAVAQPWEALPLADKIALLRDANRRLHLDARIVDWQAALSCSRSEVLLVNSAGAHIEQRFTCIDPNLFAVASAGTHTQQRSHGVADAARQGGLEQIAALGLADQAERVAHEALALLDAPPCPCGVMDLVLLPRQMVLQIHESIGHPLELDRILGDERNYAGTSFVTPEMFGHYRYGSDLLNVTFHPERPAELTSYGWDDEGSPATRAYLIRAGILERALGSASSQARAGLPGVACARADGWSRPPIDRMANLNLEPGGSTLAQLVGAVERGVLMDTNRSWSIDQSRNKFQFGCEFARVIRDGELGGVVRDPGYRGISATFWRSLAGVGDAQTLQVLGVKYCGKGEPNQGALVGHAAPACLFRNVDVFGSA